MWYDGLIQPGRRWDAEVQAAITSSQAVVLVMTPAVRGSNWVLEEVDEARALGKPIFPLLLDGEPIFGFRRIEYEDVIGGRMPSPAWVDNLRRMTAAGSMPPAPHDLSWPPSPAADIDRGTIEIERIPLQAPQWARPADLTGTVWIGTMPRDASGDTVFRFLAGGAISYTYANGATFNVGSWSQNGDAVEVETNNRYAVYTGRIDGDFMHGDASNQHSQWSWSMRRQT